MKRGNDRATIIALAAAAVSLLLSGAAAPPAQQPADQPKLDTGPMIRPTDDPAKVAAAKQFIMLYHPQTDPKNINKMIDVYMPHAIAAAQKKDPKLDAKKFEQDKRAHFLDNAARTLDNQAHVVSRHFSLQELKDLSAFFGGALGQKLTAESPRITQEIRVAHREEMMPKPGDDRDDSQAPSKPAAPGHK